MASGFKQGHDIHLNTVNTLQEDNILGTSSAASDSSSFWFDRTVANDSVRCLGDGQRVRDLLAGLDVIAVSLD